jgi:hypothetical protein
MNIGVSNLALGERDISGRGKDVPGGKTENCACSSLGDPIFLGEKPDRESVPDWMRLIL